MNKQVYVIYLKDSLQNDQAKKVNPDRKTSILSRILNLKGFFFAMLAAILYPMTNLFIKKAYFLNSFEHLVIFFNNKLILLLIINLIIRSNPLGPSGSRPLLIVRGIVGLFACIFLYVGLIIVPLSNASAISNSSIIITAIMSRIILKEKLGLQHILALILTITGVFLITKPSFLFHLFGNQVIPTNNSTSSATTNQQSDNNYVLLLGISFMIVSAIFFSSINIIVKKLCISNVKWYVITIYDSYVGLPVTIVASYLIYKYNLLGPRDLSNVRLEFLIGQIFYSSVSSVCCIMGQVSINLALKYEDPTNVTIVKACDVVVSFFLQTIVMHMNVDMFSLFGSVSIFLGIIIVFTFKLIEKKMNKCDSLDLNNNTNVNTKRNNFASKLVTFKF